MEYRRPLDNAFHQMVELQNKNLISILSDSEKADGFLTASFTAEQFKTMNDDGCIVICVDSDKVCGYVCASSVEFNKSIPIVAAMIAQFPHIIYQGKSLASYDSFIYGPVCIDKAYRGQGVLSNLFQKMLEFLSQKNHQLELLTVLISPENKRSINAHKKLGIEPVGQFEFNGKMFLILVRPIGKK